MKATPITMFTSGKMAGRVLYKLEGTEKEKALYKTAKGAYYKEDAEGNPTYLAFADQSFARGKEYTLNAKGYLEDTLSEEDMANIDLLAKNKLSFAQLQKLQILKAMEAGV